MSPDTAPSFICKDKIAFMSNDNIILAYKVIDSPELEESKNLVAIKNFEAY